MAKDGSGWQRDENRVNSSWRFPRETQPGYTAAFTLNQRFAYDLTNLAYP